MNRELRCRYFGLINICSLMIFSAVLIRLEANFLNPRFYETLLSYSGTMCFIIVIPAAVFISAAFVIYVYFVHIGQSSVGGEGRQPVLRDVFTEDRVWKFYMLCKIMIMFAVIYYMMSVSGDSGMVLYVTPLMLMLPAASIVFEIWGRYGKTMISAVHKWIWTGVTIAAAVITLTVHSAWAGAEPAIAGDYSQYPVVSLEDFYGDMDDCGLRQMELESNEGGSLLVNSVIFQDYAEDLGTVATEYYEASDPFVADIIFSGMAENELVFEKKRRLPIEEGVYGDVEVKYYTKDEENSLLINKDEKIFIFKGDVDFTSDEGVRAVRRVLDRF